MRTFALRSSLAVLLAASLNAQNIKGFQFDVKTLGGQAITEKQFADSVLIVDLWGTWCGPCVRAVPALERLYRKYKQFGLEIVGFNYEGADAADPQALTRKFAAKYGLTYHLAIGTPAIKRQVPNMRGYPTLLFFDRGLAHSHTEVGFSPLHEKKMERWVRKALGLAEEIEEEEQPIVEDEEIIEEEEEEPEELQPLPDGVIFKPGDGDTGFDFEITDIDDAELKFASLRGKVVVLAMTSTWDAEAANTAKLLNTLHDQHKGDEAVVLAASLELQAQRAAKVRAIRAFRDEHELKYRVFPAGLSFQKKIHLFTGMPLFLVFDKEGRLVLRESGSSDKTADAVKAAVDQHK